MFTSGVYDGEIFLVTQVIFFPRQRLVGDLLFT
jgi:hypothetical protein